jgi:hypothetical protein
MKHALAEQSFSDELKTYMLEQLFVPANQIRIVVAARKGARSTVRLATR